MPNVFSLTTDSRTF